VGTFGEKLRKQRELRGIELDAISSTTKISTRMLRALEDEHFDQLPGGVFNKGFVRAYARQIGLDEEEAVADYLAALRGDQPRQSDSPETPAPAAKPTVIAAPEPPNDAPGQTAPLTHDLPTNDSGNSKDGDHDHDEDLRREDRRKLSRRYEERRVQNRRSKSEDRRNKDRRQRLLAQRFRQKYPAGDPEPANESAAPIPWGKLALALLILTLILALWNFRRAQPSPASPAVASSNHSAAPAPAPTPTLTPPATEPSSSAAQTGSSPAEPLRRDTPSSASISTPIAPLTKPAAAAVSASVSPANKLPPAVSPTASPAASSSAAVNKSPANPPQPNPKPPAIQATSPATTPVAAPLAAKPPSTFTVQVRAEKTTWVSLSADGKLIAQETLIAPAHTSVHAAREIVVKTGNAAAISFLLNGKEIPAQGNEGGARTYIFNSTGFQIAP